MVALTNETQTMLFFSRIFKFNVFEFNYEVELINASPSKIKFYHVSFWSVQLHG